MLTDQLDSGNALLFYGKCTVYLSFHQQVRYNAAIPKCKQQVICIPPNVASLCLQLALSAEQLTE